MTKEEQIALDQWREDEAIKIIADRTMGENMKLSKSISLILEEYRRLVRDDVRPPVVVDRAEQVWHEITSLGTVSKCSFISIAKAYGDERFAEGKAEGERVGVARAVEWLNLGNYYDPVEMRRELLGEPK